MNMKLFINVIKYIFVLLIIPLCIVFIEFSIPIEWREIPYVGYSVFSLDITLIFIVLLFFKNVKKEQFIETNISGTILFSFVLAISIIFLSRLIEGYGETDEMSKKGISFISKTFPLSVLIVAPIFEELSIRVVVINLFRKKIPIWLLIVGTSLVFSLLHIKNINFVISSFIIGVLLAYFFIKTKNALLLILTHFFINLSTYIPRKCYVSVLIFLLNNILITAIIMIVVSAIIIINREKIKYIIQKVSVKDDVS